jgi:hypothetical protein
MQDPRWRKAMFEEMRALMKNDTWDMVSKPYDKNNAGCKWIYIQSSILSKKMLKDSRPDW